MLVNEASALRSEARAVNAGPFPGTGGYSLLSIVIY